MSSGCRDGAAHDLGSKRYLGSVGCSGNHIFGFEHILNF